jgi:hypothetical protein
VKPAITAAAASIATRRLVGRLLVAVTLIVAGTAAGALGAAAAAGAAAGTVVSGTVSGSDAGFLPGATVTLEGPQHRDTHTDADGRFTFTDVARGRYQITAEAEKYLPIERSMEVGDASVSLDIVLLRLPGVP